MSNSEDRILKWLNGRLPPEAIQVHPYSKLDYIAAEVAIDRANWIFGNLSWSSATLNTTMESLAEVDGKWEAVYRSTVRVRVHHPELGIDCFHDGTQGAAGYAKKRGDAIANACSSAESVALKRALRQFGWGLGNELYNTERVNFGQLPGRLTSPEGMSDTMKMFAEKIPDLKGKPQIQTFKAEMRKNTKLSQDERVELKHILSKKTEG